jgi:hypothetical protein
MKEQLLTFLLYQREELKKEHIVMYLRLNANGKLFVGFEFAYPHLSYWDRKPMKVTSKKCHLNIDFDNITSQKYEKFIKGYERTLEEIREKQRTEKNEFQVIGLEFQCILEEFKQN